MSRVRLRKKPWSPGDKISLYLNKELPDQLFKLLNSNLQESTGFVLEILSVIAENEELYETVKKFVNKTPSGRIFRFPEIHAGMKEISELSEIGENSDMSEKGEKSEISEISETGDVSEISEVSEKVENGESSEMSEIAQMSEKLQTSEIEKNSDNSDQLQGKQEQKSNNKLNWSKKSSDISSLTEDSEQV